ncbi:MAG: hypothetical protein ACO1NY_13990 [Pseudorhodoplanes sp.]
MPPTFLVLSCPVRFTDGSIGTLYGANDGLQIRDCATWWRAWLGYLMQVALLRASFDVSLDLVVIDRASDPSALVCAAEREYRTRGMPVPRLQHERNDGDAICPLTMRGALRHGALS